jgi:hypothetical protein
LHKKSAISVLEQQKSIPLLAVLVAEDQLTGTGDALRLG